MNQFVLLAAQAGATVWARRFHAATSAYVGVLLFGVALMLLILFGHYVMSDMRSRSRTALRQILLDAVRRYQSAETPKQAAEVVIHNPQPLYERRGLAVLSQTVADLDEPGRKALRNILFNMGFASTLGEQLKTENEDYLIELINLIGELDLVGLDSRVASLLYTHRENVELQYQAFLALARLGSKEHIVRVCLDENYAQTLSFRSLQQILSSYTGNKEELYAALLASKDAYVVRISIKQAGLEGLASLAENVAPFLEDDNFNILIDAVRSLGALKYLPAVPKISALLAHPRWEVRSVAVTALAAIDVDSYVPQLVKTLQDSEWQVRYNAALALQKAADHDAVRQLVVDCGDRYAREMYDYMAYAAKMWREAV